MERTGVYQIGILVWKRRLSNEKKIVAEIADHLESLITAKATHSPGTFDSILMSKASSTWGWVEPLRYKGYAVVWHHFSPAHQGGSSFLVFDFQPLQTYSVNLWGSAPHTNDDCHTGKDFQSLAEAIEAFEFPELHFAKLELYGEVHIEIDGSDINNVRVIGTNQADCSDEDWITEQAQLNGMAFGVAGHNDTFGY